MPGIDDMGGYDTILALKAGPRERLTCDFVFMQCQKHKRVGSSPRGRGFADTGNVDVRKGWKSVLPSDRCAPAPARAVYSIIFRLTILAFKLSPSNRTCPSFMPCQLLARSLLCLFRSW